MRNRLRTTIVFFFDTGKHQRREWWILLLLLVSVTLTISCQNEENRTPDIDTRESLVTPVQGQSWLKRLGLAVSQTQMGKVGGTGSVPAHAHRESDPTSDGLRSNIIKYLSRLRSGRAQVLEILNEPFVLSGADLYRLNCQSCHGPDGKGLLPEIGSLLDPVRGTSVAYIDERLKKRGTPVEEDFAKELASQAEAELRRRLLEGGEKMPPFDHLRGDEVEAILGYLETLAELPPGERSTLLVPQSVSRVGEHLVKGTCHVCHDATGPGGGHMAMMSGVIPSLASFPKNESLDTLLRKVKHGTSGMMMKMGDQTMPALPYFKEEEIAAAYFFLIEYTPVP